MPAPKDPEKYEEWQRKKSASLKGRTFSAETRARMAAAKLGKPGPWLGKQRDKATNAKISETLKGHELTPEQRKRHLEAIQHHTQNITPEQREKMGHRRGQRSSEEHKRNQSKALKGRIIPEHVTQAAHTPEANAKRGAAHKKVWASLPPEERTARTMRFIEAGRKGTKNQDTNIECFVAHQLDALHVVYETQKRIGLYAVDFFIPVDNLIIEVNGCFWHGCEQCGFDDEMHKEKRAHDTKRTAYLEARGYTIGIVWEHDILPYIET